jgi:hypothetical protein
MDMIGRVGRKVQGATNKVEQEKGRAGKTIFLEV